MSNKNESYNCFAAKENNTKRIYGAESEHAYRSKFERDRDRILYSKEFRRLSGKTQVFVAGSDDHIRTRQTHTLEVSQITTTICRALNLNEVLGEAIALGHDIGHTPFGHVGERTLNYVMNGCDNIKKMNQVLKENEKGFKHNLQGLKVVMDLEEISKSYKGLNLTDYTLWGIVNHSNLEYKKCDSWIHDSKECSLGQSFKTCINSKNIFSTNYYNRYLHKLSQDSWTIEALIVRQADEIAQRHHDIEDALEAKIIEKEELILEIEECFGCWITDTNVKDDLELIKHEKNKQYYLPALSRLIVNLLTTEYVNNLKNALDSIKDDYNIIESVDFEKAKVSIREDFDSDRQFFNFFSYEKGLSEKDKEFNEYLSNRILRSFLAQSMDGKSNFILRQLIKAYVSNPQQLPDKTIYTLYKNSHNANDWKHYENKGFKKIVGELRNELNEDHFRTQNNDYKRVLLRTVCDYIAGMTDKYAIEQYNLLYGANNVGKL